MAASELQSDLESSNVTVNDAVQTDISTDQSCGFQVQLFEYLRPWKKETEEQRSRIRHQNDDLHKLRVDFGRIRDVRCILESDLVKIINLINLYCFSNTRKNEKILGKSCNEKIESGNLAVLCDKNMNGCKM